LHGLAFRTVVIIIKHNNNWLTIFLGVQFRDSIHFSKEILIRSASETFRDARIFGCRMFEAWGWDSIRWQRACNFRVDLWWVVVVVFALQKKRRTPNPSHNRNRALYEKHTRRFSLS